MTGRAAHPTKKTFQARRTTCQHEEKIQAPPDRIFPLLCPIEEYKWIDEWECELVYSESGVVENNCIFTEEQSNLLLFGSPGRTTWITTLHDPDGFHRHFVIMSDEAVRKAEVRIEDSGHGVSTVRWTMVVTTLNEAGNLASDEQGSRHQLMLRFLGASLRHYCETGEMLKRNEALSVAQETS